MIIGIAEGSTGGLLNTILETPAKYRIIFQKIGNNIQKNPKCMQLCLVLFELPLLESWGGKQLKCMILTWQNLAALGCKNSLWNNKHDDWLEQALFSSPCPNCLHHWRFYVSNQAMVNPCFILQWPDNFFWYKDLEKSPCSAGTCNRQATFYFYSPTGTQSRRQSSGFEWPRR